MTRFFSLVAALVVCQTLFGQLNNTLDEYKTVYKDENVTFRQLDSITWLGSGKVMSFESLYLLEGKNRAILIDAGTFIPDLNTIVGNITDKPITLVLTHIHPDHAGAAGYFDEVWINPGDTVNIPEFMPDYQGTINYFENGQILNLGERVLEVYYTPGHTPGSVTFLEKGTNIGYCGDSFGTNNYILVTCDLDTLINTCHDAYQYFSENGYDTFYSGHFKGDNSITLDKIQLIEEVATEVRDGKHESRPIKNGVFGLNRLVRTKDFEIDYISEE